MQSAKQLHRSKKSLTNELELHFDEIASLVKKPVRDTDPSHTLFSYPAKFQAAVPQYIVEHLSSEGDLILDPFGGGGTTAVTAKKLNRSSIHYDLSPFSCLTASAKIAELDKQKTQRAIQLLLSSKHPQHANLLNSDEEQLLGKTVSAAINKAWKCVQQLKSERSQAAPILAVLIAKLVKSCGRRDAGARRDRPISDHVAYLVNEFSDYAKTLEVSSRTNRIRKIACASNHEMRIHDNSVDLIVTSPPYPGVDIEYGLIQLQRRDLNRCYRSDLPLRIAQLFYSGSVTKRQLCNGGNEQNSYYSNAEKSLIEMRRVLKKDRLAFVYCGFKTEIDQKRYEAVIQKCGFIILRKTSVLLSEDRVASSRSTHHGKDTNMMKRDILFILA